MIKQTQIRVKTGTIKQETLLQTNDMDIVEKFGKNEVLSIVQSEINTPQFIFYNPTKYGFTKTSNTFAQCFYALMINFRP